MRASRAASALAVPLLVLGPAACGADDSGPAARELSDTEHNDADVAFASDMIPHHAQALTLVDLTVGRDLDPALVEIADAIRAEQAPEIQTMAGWLQDWDEPVPETSRDHGNAGHGGESPSDVVREMEADGRGSGDMAGMLSADDLEALEEADDATFEDLWIDAMIAHHSGAIDMAQAQQDDGRYRPAVELAEDVEAAQTAETEELRELG